MAIGTPEKFGRYIALEYLQELLPGVIVSCVDLARCQELASRLSFKL